MMGIGIELVIYGMIFVSVLVLVEGLYLTVFGKSISLNSRVNRRLEMLDKSANREEVMEKLRKEMSQHLKARNVPIYALLSTKAQRAAIAFSPKQLIGLMCVIAIAVFLVLSILTEAGFIARLIAGIVIGIGGIYFWINGKAKKRMKLFEEQLPDAIELMVRSLKVGQPFTASIATVAKEMQDPLATEFGMIADEAAYGRDLGEALKDLAERLDMQDLRFLAVAVTIQQQSGGNLAEILAGLGKVIRARFRLFRKVDAITSEAKFSGNFLSAFPLAALVGMNILKPGYYDESMNHPMFLPISGIVLGLLIANIIVMRALTNIKV